MTTTKTRLDKFIWSVRLTKTRALSARLCRLGRVKVNGVESKPGREVQVGDTLELPYADMKKQVKVIAILSNRVGAKEVAKYIEDITPKEEHERVELIRSMQKNQRERGTGRPTKRERRDIDKIAEQGFD